MTLLINGVAANATSIAELLKDLSLIDAKGNVILGTGAVGPVDVAGNADGNSIVLGTGAGVGLSQTYSRKVQGMGQAALISFRGYAGCGVGAYTAARGVSDYGTFYGTHAGQDVNQSGRTLPGFGSRATGSITFSGVPAAGDTVTINGVVLTVAASPATAYQFAPGTTAAEAATNLLRCIMALTDAAILLGYYRMASASATAVNVASTALGTYGNGFTLAASGANIAVSGASLTGGTDYANTGLPASFTGDTAIGFGALGGTSRPTTRRARLMATMNSNPANGDTIRLGFNLTVAVSFRTSPSTALEIQIGASASQTLANLVTGLNGSGNATLTALTYWGQNGILFIEHNSNSVNTFEVRSYTSALTFLHPTVRGGTSNIAHNFAAGQSALMQSITSNSFALGASAGAFCSGGNRVTIGNNSGLSSNGRDWFVWGESSLAYSTGDDVIGLGRGINSGTQDAWLAISSVATDGTITFAAPHGLTDGNFYSCVWRDRAASGAAIQRAPTGTASWSNISTGLGGLLVQIINGLQARIVEGLPDAATGGRVYDYRGTGTVANIDIARFTQRIGMSVTIGASATARERTITLGSSLYRNGLWIDAIGLWVRAGEFRPPQVTVAGAWPNGYVQFASANGNFADGETVTINGTVFTAKSAGNMAAANNSLIRWFRIGADMWESLNNLLECIRNSDDQSAAAQAVAQGRYWLSSTSGVGWRLNWQSYDSAVTFTLASSKTGATVVANASTLTGLGNASSLNPPQDRGIVQLSISPLRNGKPGLASYDLASDGWRLV